MNGFLILIFFVALILTIVYFIILRNKKYENYVKLHSVALQTLKKINDKYVFYLPTVNNNFEHKYDNEIYYDSISCEDYLIYQLQFKSLQFENEIKMLSLNKRAYELYCKEIDEKVEFGNFLEFDRKFNKEKLLLVEKTLFEDNKLQPVIEFKLNVCLYCTQINGRVYDKKEEQFSEKQISLLIKRVNNKQGSFYNDKEIWNSISRVERGRVSNRMRFAIYKRDGYRCRICGANGYFDSLEIDHVKPIAKGGKSTFDNLQTLCRTCNKNKGDNY